MVACRMKPKLMCQAGAGAESGGTMAATNVGGDGDLLLHDHRGEDGDGVLVESMMMLLSVGWHDCRDGAWSEVMAVLAEKPSPPPGRPHCHVRHGTWMRLKTSRACWRRC